MSKLATRIASSTPAIPATDCQAAARALLAICEAPDPRLCFFKTVELALEAEIIPPTHFKCAVEHARGVRPLGGRGTKYPRLIAEAKALRAQGVPVSAVRTRVAASFAPRRSKEFHAAYCALYRAIKK